MKPGWCLVIFFSFFQLMLVKGQTIDLRFFDFKLNEELSANVLSCVEQDSMGFLWFGTSNGLFRYDGSKFKKYLTDNSNSFDIYDSNVVKLYADSYGKLWISMNSVLCWYDIELDSIKKIATPEQGKGLNNPFVSNYIETDDSMLFITAGNALYHYNRQSDFFELLFSIENDDFTAACFDDNKNICLGSSTSGVFFYDFREKELKETGLGAIFDNLNAVSDLEWFNKKLWIATNGGGIASFSPEEKVLKKYPVYSEYELNVRDLYVDKEQNLWMVDFTGLKLYNHEVDLFQGYYPDEENKYSISPHIHTFFQDMDKNYWSLHIPEGIRFCPLPKGFSHFDSKVNSPFHLSVDPVSAICEDGMGNLWLGNPFNGIDIFYWSKGKTITYIHDNENPESLGKGAVQVIFRDSGARMWIGTYWGGLQKFVPETHSFKSFRHDPSNPLSISSNDVRSICEDKQGNLWICSHGKGVDKFERETGSFYNYNFNRHNLSNDYTFDILCDKSNRIWVGTAWGLSMLEQGDSIFHNFRYSQEDSNSISSNIVYEIFEDRLQRMWFGTPNGLNLYVPESNSFKRYFNDEQNKSIQSINDDDNNHLWLGTRKGLVRFDPETNKTLILTEDDGLSSNTFNERAVYNNGQNNLFFGTQKGITFFNPERIRLNDSTPKIYITNIKLDNEELNGPESDFVQKNILLTDTLKISYSNKKITFEFSSTTYDLEGRIQYAYFLEGFDSKWTHSGLIQEATYTNINPGEYIFRVKAINHEGTLSEKGDNIYLVVKPPFWRTLWFLIVLIVMVTFIMVTIIKIREDSLMRAKKVLEERVRQRTMEIAVQKEKLEKQKLELEQMNVLKNRFFNIIAHDLKAPISSLVQLTQLLKGNISNSIKESNEKIAELASNTAEDTDRLLDDLLIWGKALSKNISFVFENIDLLEIASGIVLIIQPVAKVKEIEIVVNIPKGTRVFADKNNLKVILRNLISNAVKFSYPNSKVIVETQKAVNNEVLIVVSDEGVGISKDKQAELFEPKINQVSRGTAGEKGHGLGLLLCLELLKQNNGRIWVESKPGQGSRFFFTLPVSSK
ncbi:MAG: hypothetical protein JW798_05100 [Prolixibacteraceae bacterium]|nr:hypothetical protein [Prolixibacteraceae bacterium]